MISFLICTYNRERYLGKCLEALAHQNAEKSSYEIIVVDNNSSDATAQLCQSFIAQHPALNGRYIKENKQGLSHARNRALIEAKGDWVVFLDDDAFAEPQYVSALQSHIQQFPDMWSFGGRTYPQWEEQEPKWMNPFLLPLLAVVDRGDKSDYFRAKKFPIGANMGFRKALFKQIGNFNPELGRVGKNLASGEEKDLFDRIKKLNYPIHYIPEAIVRHIIPASRLEKSFIRRQAISIGHSERQRTLMLGNKAWVSRIIGEGVRWAATLVLSIYYGLSLRMAKAQMLLLFRAWVSSGLLNLRPAT